MQRHVVCIPLEGSTTHENAVGAALELAGKVALVGGDPDYDDMFPGGVANE